MRSRLMIIVWLGLMSWMGSAKAQIHLTPYVESGISGTDERVLDMVLARLNNILTTGEGMSASENGRFVLAAQLNVTGKEVLSTAPTKVVYEVEMHLGIGDGIDGKCYSSTSQTLKGVGRTENQALVNAVKQLPTQSEKVQSLVRNAKTKIITYYNQHAPAIMAKAQALEAAGKFDEALFELSAIPQECVHFKKAFVQMNTLYKKMVNADAEKTLMQAKALWAAAQTEENALMIAEMLGDISPSAACYPQVKAFVASVTKRRQQVEDRQFDAEVKVEMARLKAIEHVAAAYAKNQPRVTYHIHRWW